jgi:hypothetical protein
LIAPEGTQFGAKCGELRIVLGSLPGAKVIANTEEQEGKREGDNSDWNGSTSRHQYNSKFGNRNCSPSRDDNPALRTTKAAFIAWTHDPKTFQAAGLAGMLKG